MKLHNKLPTGIILALAMMLVTIGLVYAQPVPIGKTTWQSNPFDSNPITYSEFATFTATPTAMYDGRLTTMGYFTIAQDDWEGYGYVELSGFKSPTTTFTIGWVDIKMKYSVDPYGIDDTYRIEYSTDGTTWIVLQPDTTDPFDVSTPGAPQVQSWAERAAPDGSWDWTDIGNLRVRVYFTPGADGFCDWNTMYIYEVWATVYEPPLPPSASPTISIQPKVVGPFPAGRRFFFEVYVQDVTALAGYQITVNFNTTVLDTITGGFWSYFPFYVDLYDLNDPLGYVSITATIPVADPLYPTGVTGNFALARIYLAVAAGMTANDYSWLTFSVSLLGDPAGEKIVHGEYHGLYGTPPPETHLMGWVPASEFPWEQPVCTDWVEIYPEEGRRWHLSSHDDNGDGVLSASDQIDETMIEPPTGEVWWWHVDEVWECDASPETHVYMILTFKFKEVPEFPLGVGWIMALAPIIPIIYLWRRKGWKK